MANIFCNGIRKYHPTKPFHWNTAKSFREASVPYDPREQQQHHMTEDREASDAGLMIERYRSTTMSAITIELLQGVPFQHPTTDQITKYPGRACAQSLCLGLGQDVERQEKDDCSFNALDVTCYTAMKASRLPERETYCGVV